MVKRRRVWRREEVGREDEMEGREREEREGWRRGWVRVGTEERRGNGGR